MRSGHLLWAVPLQCIGSRDAGGLWADWFEVNLGRYRSGLGASRGSSPYPRLKEGEPLSSIQQAAAHRLHQWTSRQACLLPRGFLWERATGKDSGQATPAV